MCHLSNAATAVFVAVALLAAAAPTRAATAFKYHSYGDVVKQLHALEEAHPDLVRVYSAQDEYGVASAGDCRDDAGDTTPCKQWFIRITDETTLADDPNRPQVFFSGNLHGDEQVSQHLDVLLPAPVCSHAAPHPHSFLRSGRPR